MKSFVVLLVALIISIGLSLYFLWGISCYESLLSIIGSIASVLGIAYTIYELHNVKTQTERIKNAIKKRLDEVNFRLTYADINHYIDECSVISRFISENKYDAALIKMEILHKSLIEINGNKLVSIDEFHGDQMKKLTKHIGIDIYNIHTDTQNQYHSLDKGMILKHLMDIDVYLKELSSQLKNQNYVD